MCRFFFGLESFVKFGSQIFGLAGTGVISSAAFPHAWAFAVILSVVLILLVSAVGIAEVWGFVVAGCSSTLAVLLQATIARRRKQKVSCDFICQISTFVRHFCSILLAGYVYSLICTCELNRIYIFAPPKRHLPERKCPVEISFIQPKYLILKRMKSRWGGWEAETNGLLNRRTSKVVPRVRIPPSPLNTSGMLSEVW